MHESNRPRNVILVPSDFSAIYALYQKISVSRGYSWIYLSKKALLFTKLKTVFRDGISFIDTGDLLQKVAQRYRQEYIDYIGLLSTKNNSMHWWLTSVSEKSPFISSVFLNFCYLKIVEQQLSESSHLVIICDSYELIEAIQNSFSDRVSISFEVFDSSFNRYLNATINVILGFFKKGYFTTRFMSRISLAKVFAVIKNHKTLKSSSERIAIHSWTDAKSFRLQGTYNEIFFGEMEESIKKPFPDVFTISSVLPTLFYPKAVISLIKCDKTIFLVEEFLSISDVFRSLFSVLWNIPTSPDIPHLASVDISAIIKKELHSDRFLSSRSETSMLYYFAGRRLAQNGRFRTIVYTFENHMWEKMLCMGVRKSGSHCQLIGYAHSVVSPMYMFYTLSKSEQKIVPTPDFILVNGKIAKDRLVESGFSDDIIFVCGAYRYPYTKILNRRGHDANQARKKIILVPTSEINETVELIDKGLSAFRHIEDTDVIIKPHPSISTRTVMEILPNLPQHFSFSMETIEELLQSADLVLFTESAVAIEALIHHIPIIHIKSNIRIDMNPLEGFNLIPSVSKPEDILRISKELMTHCTITDNEYDKIAGVFFAPTDDKILEEIINRP